MSFACEIEDCAHTDRGNARWCRMHYMRWWKHGDPLVTLRSHRFVGNEITYSGAHIRVRNQRGRAPSRSCACGETAQHWSYNHQDPNEKCDERGRPYSPDPSFYVAMCISCHKKSDIEFKPPALVRDAEGKYRRAS